MQKKIVTVGLAIAVLFIWGMLFFRVYHTLKAPQNPSFLTTNVRKNDRAFRVPAYQINSYCRDPFLSVLSDTATEVVVEKPVVKPTVSKPVALPAFCGVIEVKNKKTAVLKVEKKIVFAKEGEHLSSLKVIKIQADSVVVLLDNTVEKKVLHLEKIRKRGA